MGDIPDLTIRKFVTYFLPIAMIYLGSWVIFSWYGLKKQKSMNYWLLLVICAVVAPYLIYLPFYKIPYMYADNFYHFSYVKSIAEGNFLNDIVYEGYKTYYPPLYFFILAFLLKLSSLPTLKYFIYAHIFNLLLVLFIAYTVGRIIKDKKTGIFFIVMLFFISTPGVSYLVKGMRMSAGIHAALVTPHEVIAAILLILGIFLFSREKRLDFVLAGVIGGIVALLSVNFVVYYVFSLIIFCFLRLIKTKNLNFLLRLVSTFLITFILSSPYTVPYFLSILKHGADNYHWTWTIFSNFDPYLVTFGLGFMGLTFIMGILGIITLPESNFKLILIITLIILFIGRFHVYITKPLFNVSYIPDHAYYALVVLFSFTGAVFLRDFPVKISFKKYTLERLKIGHIFLAATFFVPILIWNPVNNNHIYQTFMPIPEKIEKITSVINKRTEKNEIILASKDISPWILLLTGRHLALSGNPWCSNPTARYSLRYRDISEAFSADDIKIAKNKLDKWKVDIIVLVKEDNKWIFRASSPEFGKLFKGRGLKAEIDKNIFDNELYFIKLYEDEHYVIFRNRGGCSGNN